MLTKDSNCFFTSGSSGFFFACDEIATGCNRYLCYLYFINQNHILEYLLDIDSRISDFLKFSVKTLQHYFDYVANALRYDFNNDQLEGLNDKIKVI